MINAQNHSVRGPTVNGDCSGFNTYRCSFVGAGFILHRRLSGFCHGPDGLRIAGRSLRAGEA
eukprot:5319256-Prymnesium_polylepis.1